MQFAYQFPERTNRLILISSGTDPAELLPALHRFLDTTKPLQYSETRWRQLLTPAAAASAASRRSS